MKTQIETATPIEAYHALQNGIRESMEIIPVPVIWDTQRQMGKTTVLSKIVAKWLIKGDVWYVIPGGAHQEKQFVDKVYLSIDEMYANQDNVKIRKLNSRVELVKRNGEYNRLVSPMRFYNDQALGIKPTYNQPVLLVIDDIESMPYKRLDRLMDYFTVDAIKNIKIVAGSSGIGQDTLDWFTTYFDKPEVITTAFDSVNVWMNDIYGIKEE